MTITTDPHAKRRQADGRNAWKKMALTPGAQEQFVRWMLENGLRDILISETGSRIRPLASSRPHFISSLTSQTASVDPWGKIEDDS